MTKKAEKMVATYTEKMELHTSFFCNRIEEYKETGRLDKEYNFTKEIIKDIKTEFVDMIRGMCRFGMLSEKDFSE